MTQSARPVFHAITPRTDVSDEELAKFAASQGVRTLVKPVAQTPPVAPQIAQDASKESPRTTPSGPSPEKQPAAKKIAPALSRLSVWIPADVHVALNIRAAEEKSSNQYFVLKGLKAIGFKIDDAHLVPDLRHAATKTSRS